VPRQALRQHLDQLRRELAAQEKLDGRTRDLLSQLASDVEDIAEDREEKLHSPRERLEAAATDFEAEHPTLARILREVGDTLAKLGV
jgi:hypothetical protein